MSILWVVYPRYRLIYVYDGPASVRIIQDPDVLDGGRVLPGFSLPLSQLFDPLPPTA